MQLLSFFMVGSFYVSIKLFFQQSFRALTDSSAFAEKEHWLWRFFNGGDETLGFATVFAYSYVALLLGTVLVSIAVPIDRAMPYFRVIAAVFSCFTLASLMGITFFLAKTGFYIQEEEYHKGQDPPWQPVVPAVWHFSLLTLCGTIMLSVYLMPMILRPLDFFYNMHRYLIGLTSYLLLLPTFVNVMQVYSMSNLHDISWGNRPSVTAGTNILSADAKKQQELKANYMVFRVNFLAFWILANAAFAIVVENEAAGSMNNIYSSEGPSDNLEAKPPVINDGSIGFLEVFALYLAALVLYRVFFGGLHILKFKVMTQFMARYKTPKYDLHAEVKRLRKVTQDWDESLATSDYKLLDNTIAHQQDDEVDDEGDNLLASVAERTEKDGHRRSARARVNRLEQTCIDTDDDDFEFEDAHAEEEED